MNVQLPYKKPGSMVEWEHIEDTLGNRSSRTNFKQIMLKLDNPWLCFLRFGKGVTK